MRTRDMQEADENREQYNSELIKEQRLMMLNDDPLSLVKSIYELWWRWADFQLYILSPSIVPIHPPLHILPEKLPDSDEYEFVYPIYDHGYKLTTSKGEEMFTVGKSMYKLFLTIEKMIFLLIERLKSGGIDSETEVQVAFGGHELSQRKAFEVIINLNYNVIVTNFEPGPWGEMYLATVKRLAQKGYGYPPEAPRDSFRKGRSSSKTMKKNS